MCLVAESVGTQDVELHEVGSLPALEAASRLDTPEVVDRPPEAHVLWKHGHGIGNLCLPDKIPVPVDHRYAIAICRSRAKPVQPEAAYDTADGRDWNRGIRSGVCAPVLLDRRTGLHASRAQHEHKRRRRCKRSTERRGEQGSTEPADPTRLRACSVQLVANCGCKRHLLLAVSAQDEVGLEPLQAAGRKDAGYVPSDQILSGHDLARQLRSH